MLHVVLKCLCYILIEIGIGSVSSPKRPSPSFVSRFSHLVLIILRDLSYVWLKLRILTSPEMSESDWTTNSSKQISTNIFDATRILINKVL